MSAYLAYSYSSRSTQNQVTRKKVKGKSLIRRFKRRKLLKNEQEILKFQKFSMICMVGNSNSNNKEEGIFRLIITLITKAWNLFIKIGGVILQWLGNKYQPILNWATQHSFFIMFATLAGCALLWINYVTHNFSESLKWLKYLTFTILIIIIFGVLAGRIRNKDFLTVRDWLISILFEILLMVKKIIKYITSKKKKETLLEDIKIKKPKVSHFKEFRAFIIYSSLTAIGMLYLLSDFKHKAVGDGPLSEVVIKIVDIDPSQYVDPNKYLIKYLDPNKYLPKRFRK